MGDFKKLDAFQKAHGLALNVIRLSATMRGPIAMAIKGQMLRSALSVPTNIVEGSVRGSDRDYARFIRISIGSLSELEYHLIVASDTELITARDFQSNFDQLVDVRKMLNGFHRRLTMSADRSASKADSRSAGSS
ncbi:MAG: four helix bundle protein [Chthoniobacterales bacterium]